MYITLCTWILRIPGVLHYSAIRVLNNNQLTGTRAEKAVEQYLVCIVHHAEMLSEPTFIFDHPLSRSQSCVSVFRGAILIFVARVPITMVTSLCASFCAYCESTVCNRPTSIVLPYHVFMNRPLEPPIDMIVEVSDDNDAITHTMLYYYMYMLCTHHTYEKVSLAL